MARKIIRKRSSVRRTVKRKSRVRKTSKFFGGRTLVVMKQHGSSNVSMDRKRHAKLPGKRISKSGRRYTETRKNRSDRRGKTT